MGNIVYIHNSEEGEKIDEDFLQEPIFNGFSKLFEDLFVFVTPKYFLFLFYFFYLSYDQYLPTPQLSL